MGPDGDGGPSLTRLITETRKLATENAKFCDLNSKLSEEVKALRNNESSLLARIDSAKHIIEENKSNLRNSMDKLEKQRLNQIESNRKLRELSENYEVEREKGKIAELKIMEHVEMRREFEERLKLQRVDIHQLRTENIDILKQKECMAKLNAELKLEIADLKKDRKNTVKEFDKIKFEKEDFHHQLNITKNDLEATSDRLNSFADENRTFQENQSRIMKDIENLRSRAHGEHRHHF